MSTEEKDKIRELIQRIGDILMNYGIRSSNMDDIAKHLKISKKTLYKYFKDKADVVYKVTELHCQGEEGAIASIVCSAENAIDETIQISEFVNQILKDINPSIHFDLEKYYPESFELFNDHKRSFIKQTIQDNIERGIKEGLYRDNINADIISTIYIQRTDTIWNSSAFPDAKYSFAEVHLEFIRYHIRGIASPKGLEYLKKRISKELPNL